MSGRLPDLSDAELDVLKIVWMRDRSSAREIHEAIAPEREWSYSTTRTLLRRLVEKGAAKVGEFHGLQLYEAAISKPEGLARRVREFADRVLELDRAPVISLFGESHALTEEEIAELERLLEELKEGNR